MDTDTITYVGLDVHKRTIAVSVLLPGRTEPIEWQESHDVTVARRLARRMVREAPGKVVCCYEAGPTGYVLQRRLRAEKVMCIVVAPSLTPVQPGKHVKTDRKDARKLASLLRAGLLAEVHPPSEEQEAFRDLCRCREDAQQDLIRARHRLSKFLLRRHIVYNQTKHHWGSRHMAWLQQLRFEGDEASQAVFDSYMLSIEQLDERCSSSRTRWESWDARSHTESRLPGFAASAGSTRSQR